MSGHIDSYYARTANPAPARPPLAGEAHRIEAAFNFFAPNAVIIGHYLGFLRRIGSTRLLPAALVAVAQRVDTKPPAELLTPYR